MTLYYFGRSKFSAGVIIGVSLCTTYVAPHDGNLMSTALKLNRCEMQQAMQESLHRNVPVNVSTVRVLHQNLDEVAKRVRQQNLEESARQQNLEHVAHEPSQPMEDDVHFVREETLEERNAKGWRNAIVLEDTYNDGVYVKDEGNGERGGKRQRTEEHGSHGSCVRIEENIMGPALNHIKVSKEQYEKMFAPIRAKHDMSAEEGRQEAADEAEEKQLEIKPTFYFSDNEHPSAGDGPMRLAAVYAAGKIGDVANVVLGRNVFNTSDGDSKFVTFEELHSRAHNLMIPKNFSSEKGVALFDPLIPYATMQWNQDAVLQWLMEKFNLDRSFLRSAFVFLNEKKTIKYGHSVMGLKVEFYDRSNKLHGIKIRGYDASTQKTGTKVLRIVSTTPQTDKANHHVFIHGPSKMLKYNADAVRDPFSDLRILFSELPVEIFGSF